MSRKNTEKIVENVTKSNKTELDVIDAVKSMLATEAVLIREHVEKQLFEESQKVKKQFDQTQERLHKHSIIVEEQFQKTYQKMDEELNAVQNEFKRTNERMDKD